MSHPWISQFNTKRIERHQRINFRNDEAIKERELLKTQTKKKAKACSRSHLLPCITSNPNIEICKNLLVRSTNTFLLPQRDKPHEKKNINSEEN